MDGEGLLGGLFGLAILGGMMHCMNCGSPMKQTKTGHHCPNCGRKV